MLTSKQYAARLGISKQRLNVLLRAGRVRGAFQHATIWFIPDDATIALPKAHLSPETKTSIKTDSSQ